MTPRVPWKPLAWIVPLAVLTLAVAALLLTTLLPYQPFVLRSYVVTPRTVCAGDDVTATVTRKFLAEFDSLKLEEAWVTVAVPGYPPGRPVQSSEGVLPSQALHPSGFQVVPSPLLTRAPHQPGVYRVRVRTESHGTRWGFLPAVGTSERYSNHVRVRDCQAGERP